MSTGGDRPDDDLVQFFRTWGDRPDEIPYEEIAEIVRTWPTANGYGPYIAGRYGVPLPTARRWIYLTRLRGLLPAGTEDRPCRTCDGTGLAHWGSRPKRKDST